MVMRHVAGKLASALVALNLVTLVLMAAVSADEGYWGVGNKALPPDALPVSTVALMLEDRGYTRIYGIEAGHDAYEVKALDATGKRVRLTVDPNTGDSMP
jgi:hypothetical protein